MKNNILNFFRDPKNEHLATWIQTMSVVAGVVIALIQLSSLIDDHEFRKNEAFLKFQSEFASDISNKMGLIYEYQKNFKIMSPDTYHKKYTLEKFLEAESAIQGYLTRLSSCGRYGICNTEAVDNFACAVAIQMYTDLSNMPEMKSEWKMTLNNKSFYKIYIDNHCSISDRIEFWLWQKR